MALVSILPVSATVNYGIGPNPVYSASKSFPFFFFIPVPVSGSPLLSTATSHQADSITWSLTYFEGGWEVESSMEVATVSATTSLWSQCSFLPHREAAEPRRSQHAAQTQALLGGSGSPPAGRMVTCEQKGAL